MQEMNLLVTGGLGFIGSHFIRHAIDHVDAIINLDSITYAANKDNLTDIATNTKYHFVQMDVNDPAIGDVINHHAITEVIHFAAESHVDRSIHNPDIFITSNINGTHNLLKAVRASKSVRRLLYVSTDEVYGSIDKGFSPETAMLKPSSPYSASKAAGEMLVMAYHRTYGLHTIITRSSNNYGSHQYPEKLIPVVIRSIKRAKRIPVYGKGVNVRDWMHVSDNVRGLWVALCHGPAGSVYNISSMKPCANIDLIYGLCDLIDPINRQLVHFVKDREGHDTRYAPDSSKIRSQLGWCPLQSMASGLPGVIKWYMAR